MSGQPCPALRQSRAGRQRSWKAAPALGRSRLRPFSEELPATAFGCPVGQPGLEAVRLQTRAVRKIWLGLSVTTWCEPPGAQSSEDQTGLPEAVETRSSSAA